MEKLQEARRMTYIADDRREEWNRYADRLAAWGIADQFSADELATIIAAMIHNADAEKAHAETVITYDFRPKTYYDWYHGEVRQGEIYDEPIIWRSGCDYKGGMRSGQLAYLRITREPREWNAEIVVEEHKGGWRQVRLTDDIANKTPKELRDHIRACMTKALGVHFQFEDEATAEAEAKWQQAMDEAAERHKAKEAAMRETAKFPKNRLRQSQILRALRDRAGIEQEPAEGNVVSLAAFAPVEEWKGFDLDGDEDPDSIDPDDLKPTISADPEFNAIATTSPWDRRPSVKAEIEQKPTEFEDPFA